jgi:hypothetical protein
MVELETALAPISFNGGEATRMIGMTQILTDVQQLGGRPIAFQRLVASQIVREGESLPAAYTPPPPPPPPAMQVLRNHARAPHLRLVVSQDRPAIRPFHGDEVLRRVFDMIGGSVTPA